ncbi:4'-phosphopantetheinyl transferase [Zychaea mexicana]|uniref:4'-phosphopantetheinyl transferase n=1 Tax=Zychaea mexicana TaxID=64656 RepID=UPI0022FEDBD3|nr:4'-phosphopantetheinyl transferase [Zychaea mexicana]KAI9489673.1 4'-phosphopantetheinyl transferase [Zychaea mexicana]
MILGIGVDLVHLQRIASLVARRGRTPLATRILSPLELKEFTQRFPHDDNAIDQQVMYLGSRWCIKEAVYKALYPIHKLEWKQVTVAKNQGKPVLHVANGEAYGIRRSHVALSHDGEYAISQVVLEG